MEVSDDGFVVAAKGGAIFVGRVQPEGARKLMAPEWMQSVNLRPGAKSAARLPSLQTERALAANMESQTVERVAWDDVRQQPQISSAGTSR